MATLCASPLMSFAGANSKMLIDGASKKSLADIFLVPNST